jgi:hypothetical protein
MSDPLDLRTPLLEVARRWMPRILTQLCRDETSPLYGCADRNWWHYKIRDFPSIILQQAGYAAHLAGTLPLGRNGGDMYWLAAATAGFWGERAQKHHAFEEYYPWEQGYPPLAFSSLAMAKLADSDGGIWEAVVPGLRVAARQLRTRFEDKAGNQQVAGLAALAWIDKVLPDEADHLAFARQKARTLALQHEEGWYWEYDGPDLGYLAVTIDCLWDLYDATGDQDFRESIRRALAFTARFPAAAPGGVGLHNSRNTDYLVPYGIVRSALQGDEAERRDAAVVAAWAFAGADRPDHFFAAVDDRYICHYIGHSVLRALHLLSHSAVTASPPPDPAGLVPGSGHYLAPGLIVSCRKGGIVSLRADEKEVSDFGWILTRGKTQYVTHWWSDAWRFREEEGGALAIEGPFFPHKERLSTPPKHMVLRVLSFFLGRRLTAILKRVLIFKRSTAGPTFSRHIQRDGLGLVITDLIGGMQTSDKLVRAPRASKRHVASADSFHPQDFREERGFGRDEERTQTPEGLMIVTRYTAVFEGPAAGWSVDAHRAAQP